MTIVYNYLPNNIAAAFTIRQSDIYITVDKEADTDAIINNINVAIISGQKEGTIYKPA
jgi:hypothetical protein